MTGLLLPPRPIAVIGLGRMGTAIAERLIHAGYQVHGHDIEVLAAERASKVGVSVHDTCASAVASADAIITLLPDAPVVEAVASELLGAAAANTCWLEMTSSHPALTRGLAERSAAKSIHLLDTPVAGGVAGAERGTLTVMAAAPAASLVKAKPILDVFAKRIIHISERPGDGDVAKTINNLLAAGNLALASEGLTLGLKEGLDAQTLLEVLNASSGTSFATAVQIPNFALSGTFDARFTVGQYAKDIGIALDVAERHSLKLEIATRVREVWDRLAKSGHVDEDYTRIASIFSEAAGIAWATVSQKKLDIERSPGS